MIRCLSCSAVVGEREVTVKHEVLVCNLCKVHVDGFVRAVAADLRLIDSLSGLTLQKALLKGEFRRSWHEAEPLDRLALLIRYMQETKPCPSPSTPSSNQLTQSSGEPLLPHASTLTALAAAGRKSSNSPTE